MPTTPQITHELVNDLPVLMHLLRDELRLDHWRDTAWPRHGNWQGWSLGQVLVTWLAHSVSEQNHFMSHVQDWANSVPHTLARLWGQPVRPTDFSDDRLAEVVRVLSLTEVWHALEQAVTRQMVQVYDLTPKRVRLDTTTAAESLCALLQKLAALHLAVPITLFLDNARYQKCGLVQALAARLNIELCYWPTYSPNLNLIERVWKFVKRQCLYSKYYPEFASFKAAIETCLREMPTTHPAALDSLLTLRFQQFSKAQFMPA